MNEVERIAGKMHAYIMGDMPETDADLDIYRSVATQVVMPLLAQAWREGYQARWDDAPERGKGYSINPYEVEI